MGGKKKYINIFGSFICSLIRRLVGVKPFTLTM